MRERAPSRWFLLSCVLLSTFTAWADGDGPTRAMTGAEAAAFDTLQGTLRAALPAIPPDYAATFSGFDRKEVWAALSPGHMVSMSFSARYTLKQEAIAARQQQAFTDLTQGSADQQARRAELAARSDELKRARKSARSPEEKERIRAELKKLDVEENAMLDEMVAGAQAQWSTRGPGAAPEHLPPRELSIQVFANQAVHVQDIAQPYPVPKADLAFAQNEKCQDASAYCITVLLGDFVREKKISGTTQYTPRDNGAGVSTQPRGLVLIVAGPQDRQENVRDFLRQIDIAKLRSLLP